VLPARGPTAFGRSGDLLARLVIERAGHALYQANAHGRDRTHLSTYHQPVNPSSLVLGPPQS
jgi:hypothetical protein